MEVLKIEKLHLWTDGDSSVGIPGNTAEVSAPGWLISSADFEGDDFKATLEAFREQVRDAFELIWPDEKVYALYDFELREADELPDAAND